MARKPQRIVTLHIDQVEPDGPVALASICRDEHCSEDALHLQHRLPRAADPTKRRICPSCRQWHTPQESCPKLDGRPVFAVECRYYASASFVIHRNVPDDCAGSQEA